MPLAATLAPLVWPDFGPAERPPEEPAIEFENRIERAYRAMRDHGLTHLAVYGDREHFANLCWLTGFDPRFEEALLILSPGRAPLMLVGNECASYLKISPVFASLRHERYQPFSLPDQPCGDSRTLEDILRAESLGRTGIADWKVFPGAPARFGAPHWIVETLAAASDSIVPATGLLNRLRSICSFREIARFEWTNSLASGGVRRMIDGVRDGITDHELVSLARYNGEPLGCHWGVKTAKNRISLASPNGSRVERGGPLSLNICYRGANVCRAGWVAEDEAELPAESQGYIAGFAGPYFAACAEWLAGLSCGASAGTLHALIEDRLPFDRFGVFLNPGHWIHLEEWLGSPFYKGSEEILASGMVIQSDIIPSVPRFFSTRMEDGYAIADESLQAELRANFPAVLARCLARREFLREVLGIDLSDGVLPLSNMAGIVSPFFLRPDRVFAITR